MTQKEITLTVSIPEANGILQSLANQPFNQVADLIFKLKGQAEAQVQANIQQEQAAHNAADRAAKAVESATGE
jgi:hypothetical protein